MWNMFKANNRNTRCRPGVFIVNFEYIWHVAVLYFWLTLKMEMVHGIIYCLNVNLPMHMFRKALCNSHLLTSHYLFFCQKQLPLRCCVGLILIIVTWSTKILTGIRPRPPTRPHPPPTIKYENLALLENKLFF